MKRILILFVILIGLPFASSLDDIGFGIGNFAAGGTVLFGDNVWNAALSNPAILAGGETKDTVGIESSKWFVDTSIRNFSYATSVGETGINLGFANIDDDDGIIQTDISGNALGTLKYQEQLYYFGLGTDFAGFDVGTSIKYLNKKFAESKDYYTSDLGIIYDSHSFWKVAVKIDNILTNAKSNDRPLKYTSGISFLLTDFRFHIELTSNTNRINIGVVYSNQVFSIVAGQDVDQNISAGLQLNLWNMAFEYAYKNIDKLGAVNRFGLAYFF